MITDYLTQDERAQGARMLVWHSFYNGLGFGFLAETIIYLMALQFNPTNTQLGYISSAVHIAGLALFILPQLTHGINLRKVYFAAWIARGSVAFTYFLTLFTTGQTAVYIILVGYTLFCVSRIVGVAMAEPVQQMLATSTTRGMLVSRFFISFQVAKLASQLLSFAFTSAGFLDEQLRLLILIFLGIVTNTIAAFYLRGIPYREKSRYRRGSNLLTIFLRTIKEREQILVVLIRCITLSSAVLIGFMIPFLRVVAGLEQNMVFLFSLIGTLGMITSGMLLRPFVDTVGSKPLLTAAFIGQAMTLTVWMILGGGSTITFILILGFGTTFLQAAVMQLVGRLVINTIPSRDKIGFTSMLNFITALFAFGTGMLGGFLIDAGEVLSLTWGSSYSLTFAAGAVMNILALILVLHVKDSGSLRIKDAANILFSMRNLRTFLDIYNFHLTEDPVKRQTILTSINYSPAPQAEPELRTILNNPIAPDKEQVLISLYKNPRPGLLDLIMREALNIQSPQQRHAIFALGAYPQPESRETLIRLYRCNNPQVAANAAKSLARIGSPQDPEELRQMLLRPDLPTRASLNLMVALSADNREDSYLSRLLTIAGEDRDQYHRQSILALAAALEGFTPGLDKIFAWENSVAEDGLNVILEEARSFIPFHDHAAELRGLFRQAEFSRIAEWCARVLKESGQAESPLGRSLCTELLDKSNRDIELGRLYFLFQLLNRAQQQNG